MDHYYRNKCIILRGDNCNGHSISNRKTIYMETKGHNNNRDKQSHFWTLIFLRTERKREKKAKVTMSTLAVPAQVPTAAEDSEQLKKAFKGFFFFFFNF